MLDTIGLRTQANFAVARTKALFREVLSLLTGLSNRLLAFDEVSENMARRLPNDEPPDVTSLPRRGSGR